MKHPMPAGVVSSLACSRHLKDFSLSGGPSGGLLPSGGLCCGGPLAGSQLSLVINHPEIHRGRQHICKVHTFTVLPIQPASLLSRPDLFHNTETRLRREREAIWSNKGQQLSVRPAQPAARCATFSLLRFPVVAVVIPQL